MSVINQLDNDIRSENTIRGMRERLNSGRWVWKAPLGYLCGGPLQPSLTIDRDRGPLVQDLFRLIAGGTLKKEDSLSRIFAGGLRSAAGRPLTWNTLNKLLRNRIYRGRLEVPKWGIERQGDWVPLVDAVTLNRVQDVMDGRAPVSAPHVRNNPEFPLRGSLLCPVCKKAVTASLSTGKSGARHGYYRCTALGHFNFGSGKIHAEFYELLKRLRPD